MTAIYNMTFVSSSNPTDLLGGINTASGGIIGALITIILYVIILKANHDNGEDFGTGLLYAGFIVSIISGVLFALQWIPDYILGVNILVLVIGIFIKLFGGR